MSSSLRHARDDFLASLSAERGLSPATVSAYRRDLTQYFDFLDENPSESVEGFVVSLKDLGLQPTSIGRKIAAVRGLHRFMVMEGVTQEDPTTSIENPRRRQALPKALDVDQVLRLLDGVELGSRIGVRDRALLEFMYGTGARVSEAVAVDLVDIDLVDRFVRLIGKGDKQRLVPLGRHAVESISRYLPIRLQLKGDRPDPGAVFLNSRGARLSRQGVWLIVRKAGTRVGLSADEISPHVLRHSAATHMVEGGADLRTVQEMLGHASISTTQVYTRVSPEHLFEVYTEAHPRSR